MTAQEYYNQLIASGVDPVKALVMTNQQYPDFVMDDGTQNPDATNPDPTDTTTPTTGTTPVPDLPGSMTGEILQILNGKGVTPDTLDTSMFGPIGERYGFTSGEQGYPDYRSDTKTISVGGGYLLYENGSWRFQPTSPEGGTGTTTGGTVDPSYLAPFGSQDQLNQQFGSNVPQFAPPGDFAAPTGESILQDPSYQFRRDQAVDVLQKTKAAQGLYHSGGTINDIANLASNFAGTEYGNVWAREFAKWNQDWQNAINTNSANLLDYQNARSTYFANQQNPFDKLNTVAQLGANTAAIAG